MCERGSGCWLTFSQ
uniref:Uncharacterized protein n=1 Tax=Anguilla anguilla TaxID=7936 RepID=A0A0E9VA79_ANGAN